MSVSMKRFLYWSPRIICILSAAFISIFAMDVFDENHGLWQTLLALTMHLIPTCLIVVILIVSWRWEIVGGILFNALAVAYIVWAWGRFDWMAYAFISGPLFITGILFLLNWRYRSTLQTR
jgi:hypothetical protein